MVAEIIGRNQNLSFYYSTIIAIRTAYKDSIELVQSLFHFSSGMMLSETPRFMYPGLHITTV
jgi:hypothetical protein